MQYVRALIESRPQLSRVPDPSMVVDPLSGADRIVAARGDGYAFVYSPQGRKFTLKLGVISGDRVKATWFNPRTGATQEMAELVNRGEREFVCPAEGFGADWVLIVDDAGRKFPAPGR